MPQRGPVPFAPATVSPTPARGAARPARLAATGRSAPAAGTAATLTLLAAVLCFWGIGSKSLWRDEGFNVSTSLRSWRALAGLSLHTDTNGVLYNVLVKAWSGLGTSEAALRSLSAVFAVALVPAVYALGCSLLHPRAGVVAALLVAGHGSVITYAQQIRPYSLSMVLAVAASAAFAAEVRRPRRIALVTWICAVVLLAHTHLLATSLVGAHLVSLRWLAPSEQRLRRRIGAAAAAVALSSPVAVLISTHEEGQGLLTLRPGTFRDILHVLTGRGGVPGFAAFAVLGGAALIAWPGRGWRSALAPVRSAPPADANPETGGWPRAFLACWTVVPPVVLLAGSFVSPMIIGRYLLFVLPGALLWAAAGIDRLLPSASPAIPAIAPTACRRRRLLGVAALAVVAAGSVRGTWFWLGAGGGAENWRAAARTVFAQSRSGDGVAFANDSVRLFFEYYRPRTAHGADPDPVFPDQPWGAFGTGDHTYLSFTARDLERGARTHERLWVVIGEKHDNTAKVPAALGALARTHHEAARTRLGDIVVLRYDRAATAAPVAPVAP